MNIEIRKVDNKTLLKKFVQFPFQLYKNDPIWVPPLNGGEYKAFDPAKNPSLALCDTALFLAYRGEEIVGRVAGIINRRENELLGLSKLRFGWLDMIDDIAVSKALFAALQEFGKAHQMEDLEGPVGFTNLDKAAMLTFGFDEQNNTTTLYNHAYYPQHMEQMGFEVHTKWIEMEFKVPEAVPEKIAFFSKKVKERYGLQSLQLRTKADIKKYITPVFNILNQAYDGLHNFVPLTPEQQQYYAEDFLDIIHPDYISCVSNDKGELIAFGVAIPSLVQALRKAKGSLLPFGWYHLLKAMKSNDRAELILIGVLPEWQRKGSTAIIFQEIMQKFIDNGIKYVESNPEQEQNDQVQALWKMYESRHHKARCTYTKRI